ncbi:ADD domain-containing protein 1 isoform 2-T2 [Glossina fuscipes fuscipes]
MSEASTGSPGDATAAASTPMASTTAATMPSPSVVADHSKAANYEFDSSLSEEERRFYLKAYPTIDVVRERKVHCTVCKTHIGTAPIQESNIKMHPILRVTHCVKCHDFYNSGEFSKGEDGSELYCRWCGQGGEVYCCSSCPYVFCKSCIVKNLSRGVVVDIEQNENWSCFSCAPKILWPLRAQHWALMCYIEQQKREIYALNLSETELKQQLSTDRSKCCRLAKAKCGNMSDSLESLDSVTSKRSFSSNSSAKKKHASAPSPQPSAKRPRNNDDIVCTPDLMSMLEPDCQITVSQKLPTRPLPTPAASAPKILSIKPGFPGASNIMTSTPKSSVPPPLVLRNTGIKVRPGLPAPVVRRTVIGPRTPTPGATGAPVYHTINGYRIDLNSAAQQETFRLPNGKLIQVKRQGALPVAPTINQNCNSWQQQQQHMQQQRAAASQSMHPIRSVQITQQSYQTVQPQPQHGPQSQQHPHLVRYPGNMSGSGASINHAVNHNGGIMQVINGQVPSAQTQPAINANTPLRPIMIRHIFPDTPIGQARSQLQEQVFNAMEICTHLTNKVQTLTNSNAYKQARNYLEVKELYIHLSYLLTYAIGRFKGLQDKCLADMRQLGFVSDADCLENGQLAADKQASDDEDNEIEIVEPKTDLITLDSDDDEPSANRKSSISPVKKSTTTTNAIIDSNSNNAGVIHGKIGQTSLNKDDTIDLMSVAQSFLASMLEVDMSEGSNGGTQNSPNSTDSLIHKKQPRKKTTNKPNPTLIKQKEIMERERLEEMKRTDVKLKMKCSVALEKAEDVYPFAKDMLTSQKTDEEEVEEKSPEVAEHQQLGDDGTQRNSVSTMVVDTGKETVKVEVVLEDDLNTSNEGEKLEDSNVKNNEEEVLIAQPASEENNDISIVKEIEEEAILAGTEEKINEPKVDEMSNENEDLDVDKEIAKVLKDCNQRLEEEESVNNIDRSINDESPIKICSPSPKDIRNLKDTLDRTIEKLITDDRPCKDSLTKSELSEPVISLAKEQQTVANNPDA